MMRTLTIALATVLVAAVALWRVYATTGLVTFWLCGYAGSLDTSAELVAVPGLLRPRLAG